MARLTRGQRRRRRDAAPDMLMPLARAGCLVVRLDKNCGHYRITAPHKRLFDFWAGTRHWRSLQSSLRGDGIEALLAVIGGRPEAASESQPGAAA